MSEEKKKGGFFGGLKDLAVDAGLIETGESSETPTTSAAPQPTVAVATPAATLPSKANPDLVEKIRGIALAPANSPLMNSFMKDLRKAQQIEADPLKSLKMALVFSDIDPKEIIKEIETAIAANLTEHKLAFGGEVQSQRTAVDARFAERQQKLEAAVAEDRAAAEEIQKRLTANSAELSSLSGQKATEVAKIDQTEEEAMASLAVVENEINSLLANLKTA